MLLKTAACIKAIRPAKGRQIVINVNCKYFPSEDGEIFLQRSKKSLEDAGYHFNYSNLIK
jgi:hypothetical protein